MNKFEKMYNPLGLRIPKRLAKPMALKFGKALTHPEEWFCDAACGQIEDQGQKPYCAAYSATSWLEGVLWRVTGNKKEIDPSPLYAEAKRLDGDPIGDGTTLEAVMQAILNRGYFPGGKVKTFGGGWFGNDFHSALEAVKMAIFRYGGCIIGCDIDTSWYTPKKGVVRGGGQSLGGHAVTAAGYDEGGIVIVNSWGESWGRDGKAYLPNDVLKKELIYGAVITNCLNGME